jgi:hypothetical protein
VEVGYEGVVVAARNGPRGETDLDRHIGHAPCGTSRLEVDGDEMGISDEAIGMHEGSRILRVKRYL